ncbi:MAG: DNA polymerase III subunit alpha, partial [Myxococcales bacterium]|nr:DNA polymerase III subunit alpha [Myxococcales bacterium]
KGCAERGVPEAQASEIFDTIEKFAGYGFNKSHSAAYGLITYQTGWLKQHYPVEFMAALLTCDGDNTDKIVRLIAETRSMGITVLPPSVNHSDMDFTTGDNAIRFGLGAVKGVGGGAVEAILQAREDGPFDDVYDFCERVDLKRVNRRVMEALVKCGAFDELGGTRLHKMMELDRAIERGQTYQRDKASGQFDLFGALAPAAPAKDAKKAADDGPAFELQEEWPDRERLGFEKECLGFYVSGHPLDRYVHDIRRLGCAPIGGLGEGGERDEVTIAGVFVDVRQRPTRSGDGRMAFIQLEDLTGRMELIVFPRKFNNFEAFLDGDEPVLLTARLQREGDGDAKTWKLLGDSCTTLRDARAERATRARLTVASDKVGKQHLPHLVAALQPGLETLGVPDDAKRVPVELIVRVDSLGRALVRLPPSYQMIVDDTAISSVERIIGRGNVAFV